MLKINKFFVLKCIIVSFCCVVTSCATKQSLAFLEQNISKNSDDEKQTKLELLRKVYDNEVYAKALSSKIKFSISTEKNNFNVSGTLKMKKDEVIRIQLTPLGLIEAGRIEFTKEYVLFVNRMNKEYVKARYDQVDFLNRNGLDFYSLQALFWNTLFVPGTQKMSDSLLKKFTVLFIDNENTAFLSLMKDAMSYQWTVNKITGCVNAVDAAYDSKTYGKTVVECKYENFKSLCGKQFPSEFLIKLHNDKVKGGKTISLGLVLGDFDTDSKWDTFSSVSDKYKAVNVQSLINRLLGM